MTVVLMHLGVWSWSRKSPELQTECQNGKAILSVRGMVVGARRAGLSISQSAQLLGFSHTTISRVYKHLLTMLLQQSICEATTRTTLRWMSYNSRRPHRVTLISTTKFRIRISPKLDS